MLKLFPPLPLQCMQLSTRGSRFTFATKLFCGNVNILLILHGTCHGLNTWQEFHKFATATAQSVATTTTTVTQRVEERHTTAETPPVYHL